MEEKLLVVEGVSELRMFRRSSGRIDPLNGEGGGEGAVLAVEDLVSDAVELGRPWGQRLKVTPEGSVLGFGTAPLGPVGCLAHRLHVSD